MDKAITTSMLIIASVVASLALINAVFPAMGKSSGALATANQAAAERIRVFALGVGSEQAEPIPRHDRMGERIPGFKLDSIGEIVLSRMSSEPLAGAARATGGFWARVDEGGVGRVLAALSELREDRGRVTRGVRWTPRFQWFVAGALLFLMMDWAWAWRRALDRLERTRDNIAVGAISGAVGSYSNIDPFVEQYVCEKLGLTPEPLSTQVIPRDRHAQYLAVLATVLSPDALTLAARYLEHDALKAEAMAAYLHVADSIKGAYQAEAAAAFARIRRLSTSRKSPMLWDAIRSARRCSGIAPPTPDLHRQG